MPCHEHILQQQNHVAQREVAAQGAPEQHQIDREEDDVHATHAQHVHEVPPPGLLAGERNGGGEVALEQAQLAQLRHEGLDHLHLADDLGEAPLGRINVLVFVLLPDHPLFRRQHRQVEIQREDHGQQHSERPVVDRGDHQDHDDRQQHREEVVGEGLDEVRQPQNRAVQAGDDRAGDLLVVVALRQGQQLREVAVGEDLPHPHSHDVAEPAAHVAHNRVGELHRQQPQRQPDDRTSGGIDIPVAAHCAHDGVRGHLDQVRRNESEHRGDGARDHHDDIEGPEFTRGPDNSAESCDHE